MEVSDGSDGVSSHHSELVDIPVGEVRFIHDCHLAFVENINHWILIG